MALLSKDDIIGALKRLGELALENGYEVDLLAVGGTVMVLSYGTRQATHDIDAIILAPETASIVRQLAHKVAQELNWPDDWLNDGAKGFLVGMSENTILFSAPGIILRCPAIPQLLAMKLSAWRDNVDIDDAEHLLRTLIDDASPVISQDEIWTIVEPYLTPGDELKAKYAFLDLWETLYDQN